MAGGLGFAAQPGPVTPGVLLDFGATAKALAADRAAAQITRALGCGVLVSLGGDIAVAGSAPAGGWRIAVAEDHTQAQACPQQIVTIGTGGLATSSTTRRRWRRGGRWLHHIVDPRTGASRTARGGLCRSRRGRVWMPTRPAPRR
ncbi:MAG TPA: FAD:protein FMN transferase [Pseudonocardiaceae bacterium]|nr:FAD:protein FMN transferase [Pseudonocardiaceae bacterium]